MVLPAELNRPSRLKLTARLRAGRFFDINRLTGYRTVSFVYAGVAEPESTNVPGSTPMLCRAATHRSS